ncbi:DUF6418 domain-containing protein [Pseudomonas indica]|uniref:DUF6418 domain-containing protein n=1 Tax=Pseudomonas indica TaxID=137658 RepID=UPI003FD0BC5F
MRLVFGKKLILQEIAWICFSLILCFFAFAGTMVIGGGYFLWGVVAFLSFLTLGLFLFFRSQLFFWLVLPFSFPHFFSVVSSVYLETGAYIAEQEAWSYATGGAVRLVSYLWALFFSAYLVFFFLKSAFGCGNIKEPTSWRLKFSNGVFILVILLLLFLYLGLFLYGSPVFQGVQRFEYWAEHPMPLLHSVLQYGFQLSFLIGVIQVFCSEKRRFSVLCVLLFVFVNILYGEKFTGIFLVMVYFFCGIYIAKISRGEGGFHLTASRFSAMVAIASGMFSLVYFHYTYIHAVDGGAFRFIFDRAFSLQGHTWWGIDALVSSGYPSQGIGPIFAGREDEVKGIYSLMEVIAPKSIYDSYVARGVSFTMGFPAILIFSVGYSWAFVLCVFFGAILGVVFFVLVGLVRGFNVVGIFLAVKVVLILSHALNMGGLYLLFDTRFAFYFLLMLIFFFVSRRGVRFG